MHSYGIAIGDQILPGTDWCWRDPVAWWYAGDYQTGKRAPEVTLLVGHWTAGEAGPGTSYDDGQRVVRGMKARMSTKVPGRRLRCSVQFVVGACDPVDAEYAPIWQTMDLTTAAAIHVGLREVYRRSIGVEVVSAGRPGNLDLRKRPRSTRVVHGKPRDVLLFQPGQLRSWRRLVLALTQDGAASSSVRASMLDHAGIRIPRHVPILADGRPLPRAMTMPEMRRFRGSIEHLSVPGSAKIDAATMLLESLVIDPDRDLRDPQFLGVPFRP